MATTVKKADVARVSVSLNPGGTKRQTLDTLNKLVAQAVGRGGCDRCGRVASIDIQFLGDPGPDMEQLGAFSVDVRTR